MAKEFRKFHFIAEQKDEWVSVTFKGIFSSKIGTLFLIVLILTLLAVFGNHGSLIRLWNILFKLLLTLSGITAVYPVEIV